LVRDECSPNGYCPQPTPEKATTRANASIERNIIFLQFEAIPLPQKSAREAKEFIFVFLHDLLDIAEGSIIHGGEIGTQLDVSARNTFGNHEPS
jgi:hypothetical protein